MSWAERGPPPGTQAIHDLQASGPRLRMLPGGNRFGAGLKPSFAPG